LYTVLFEILGVFVLAAVWMTAILRLIERRQWSPMRPAVMAIVCAGCLALMADAMLDWLATGTLRNTFYLAAFNLGMALFDLRVTYALGRAGRVRYAPGAVAAE
jgi:hypothetical protein